MAIDPTKSSGANPASGARIDQTGGNQSARQSGELRAGSPAPVGDAAQTDDTVQLSAEAREARLAGETTSASGISQDRLQEILKRLTSGYYDNPQVIDKVARKVGDELGGTAQSS
jgi:anti-sigma28 factor (negative regulator of flagellin synthesis)